MATICIMILILFIGFWIFKSAMSKPYHYEGIVQSIRLDEKGNAFLEVKSVHGDAVIKVKIENSMSFSFWDGSRMKAEDLRIGDIMNANFKKRRRLLCSKKIEDLPIRNFSENKQYIRNYIEENNVSVNGAGINDGKIYYPNIPGMDMYVTYFTYNNNGVIEYMADVMVVLNENDAKSSLVRIFDAVEMYDKVKFSDMADKVIKCTASGIISSFLPTSGSIAVEAIMNLAEPFIPQSHYTNNATLTLKVSSISTISHMWRKTNNKFYFRLATNAATVKESWIFVDTTGSHYYSYNEYYIESPNYRNVSIAANHTESTSFSIPDIKYQTKGFLGIYFTKLTVSPYYAGAPASLAFD